MTQIAPHCPECDVAKGADHLPRCPRKGTYLAMDPIQTKGKRMTTGECAYDPDHLYHDHRECRCDPPGSGEEFCTGHCVLRAEVARLRAGYERMWSALKAEVATGVRVRGKLRSEVEQLRTAIQRTADAPCTHCGALWLHGEINTAHFIAQQSLPKASA